MSYVTLEKARKHLEVIHSADDELIQDCIDAAEDYAAQYMGRDGIYDGQDWRRLDAESESSSDPETVPASVVRAILFLTADYYEHRTQTVVGTITSKIPSAEHMLHFYRIGLGV
jgi:hypothetical protein